MVNVKNPTGALTTNLRVSKQMTIIITTIAMIKIKKVKEATMVTETKET